jgi:subtilase family serine protease/subtilisin family serine protease
MSARPFLQALLALALLVASESASAGRVHPDLEKKLSQKAADGNLTPVIVELEERVSPSAAGASAPERDRRARGRAVVNALKDKAEKTQGPIRKQLEQEDPADARNVQPLWVVNAIALEASETTIRKLASRPDVREVRADKSIPAPKPRATMKPKSGGAPPAWNLEQIRAPQVWALGHSGTGMVVGSFDTGVDWTHPDLTPNYRGNHAISWFDPYGRHDEPYDNNGHGTHTTGTMVASGEFSGYLIGVAPGARWIAAKGWTDGDNATASAFHLIFQWFLAPGGDPANAPDVVNASWGMDPPSCDPEFVTDVQALRASGIVPVFASGNSGPDPSTTLAPGSYATSFTVGATDFADDIAEFSSQGPSQCDGGIKPDVSAPGVAILSTLPGGIHFELDGTSMATPHVSGAAAVLRGIVPTLTVEEIEAAIVDGSIDAGPPGPDNAFGAGRLDLLQSASLVLGIPLVGIETSATAAEAGLVHGRFTVRRKGSTAAELIVPYTVAGTATPGSDYVALPGSVTIPVGATSATIEVTPFDDAIVELTETVVVTLTPNPAYLASPAQATVNITSDEIPPDLVVSAFTAPSTGGAGSPITLNETTRNQGAAGSEASTTAYYLSADYLLDAGDTLLGTRAVPPLAAGASSSGAVTVTLPAGLGTGTWYLLAKADHADLLVETQEGNNVAFTTVLVGSDLQVSALTAPTDAGAGLTLAINETTRNAGSGTAAATTTSYYLSVDGTLDAGDVLLGSRAVPSLAAGATSAGSVSVTIPAATATGTYTLIARADSGDAVQEVYENNNTRASTLRIGPDLGLTSFLAPSAAGIGESFSVTDTTRNAGGGTAAASTTRYYLSANGLLDAGDVAIGSRAVASLAPGATSTGSAVVTIPAGTVGGQYFLIAAADADGVVAETTESNNIINRGITIGSDLHVLTFTAPSDAGAGIAISITDTTRNQGTGSAGASTTSFYLSLDATLDAGDVLLGSRAIPALAGGASSSGSTSVTIPAGTATGTYTLFARADSGDAVSEAVETNNVLSRSLRIGPDLQVTALTAPDSTGAGASITLTDTTRNAGAGNAAASTTRIYLSADWLLDPGDTLLASRAVPVLGPGVSSTGSVTATIPAATPGGAYYLIAVADGDNTVAETQEANNTFNRNLLIGPDLGMLALSLPTDSGAGLTISIVDQTRNAGGGTAPATTTSFYLSADATLDAGDVLLGSRAVPSLAAGGISTGTTSVTIPAGTATGTYNVFARADATDAVPETYENNNTTSRTLRIGPDLTVESLTVPGSAGAGTAISVQDSVRNVGGGSSTATLVRYYLSTDGLPGGGDVELGSRALPALAPNTSNAATTSLTIPVGTAGGSYYVIAVADPDNTVAETTETNNFTNRVLLIGTDLVVTTFTAPADGGAGLPLVIGDTTRNQGAGTAPATGTSYYLSLNASLEASDVLLGTRSVASLASGASDSGSLSVTIPAGTATGTWYLFARADSGDVVAEVNESNNISTRTVRIGPDMVVPTFTVPTAAGAGETISVTVITQNSGGGTAGASTTQVYLSADWILSAGDTLLATRDVGPLAPGASDTATLSVTLPAGLAGGTHYLIAVADSGGTVGETQEGNNATYRNLLVGSDLQVSGFTVPASGGAGLGLALVETTRNAGAGTTPASTTTYYLSADAALDASDVVLGSHAVPPLGPGATDTANVTVTIPAGTATGTYYVFAKADSGGVVSETYENNNVTNRAVTIGPDMNVASLVAPGSVTAGSTFSVTDTTRNAGGGAAPATTTRYYLSSNGVPDAPDVLLGSRAVPALAPGATDTATVTLTLPAGTAAGGWFVLAVADGDGVVAETIETNNFANRGLTVN